MTVLIILTAALVGYLRKRKKQDQEAQQKHSEQIKEIEHEK